MTKFTYTNDLFMIMYGRRKLLMQKRIKFTSFHGKRKIWKYIDGLLSIIIDEEYLENRKKHWINDSSTFNNEHIIQRYNIPQSNIHQKPHFISCMKPTGFINCQDESRCYVNSHF